MVLPLCFLDINIYLKKKKITFFVAEDNIDKIDKHIDATVSAGLHSFILKLE